MLPYLPQDALPDLLSSLSPGTRARMDPGLGEPQAMETRPRRMLLPRDRVYAEVGRGPWALTYSPGSLSLTVRPQAVGITATFTREGALGLGLSLLEKARDGSRLKVSLRLELPAWRRDPVGVALAGALGRGWHRSGPSPSASGRSPAPWTRPAEGYLELGLDALRGLVEASSGRDLRAVLGLQVATPAGGRGAVGLRAYMTRKLPLLGPSPAATVLGVRAGLTTPRLAFAAGLELEIPAQSPLPAPVREALVSSQVGERLGPLSALLSLTPREALEALDLRGTDRRPGPGPAAAGGRGSRR